MSPAARAASTPLAVQRHVPLAARTTLGLGGPIAALTRVDGVDSARAAIAWARAEGLALAVLGGGSNSVGDDAGFAGCVLEPVDCGVDARALGADDDGIVELRAGAGLSWDELVAYAVRRDLAGIAALSGIPGRVGAAPVQNIGAYGEQLADVFVAATCLDLRSGAVERWDGARAGFGYRDSAWKREGPGRTLILDVTLRLRRRERCAARYPDLQRALADAGHDPTDAPLAALRAAVLRVRRGKAMVVDPLDDDSRSAGSFFVNPIVAEAAADAAEAALRARGALATAERLPRHPADAAGEVKLSAAYLIERCGWRRGLCAAGGVGISRRHVLALVHHGGGSSAALWALADAIAADVAEKTGITLVPEPQPMPPLTRV